MSSSSAPKLVAPPLTPLGPGTLPTDVPSLSQTAGLVAQTQASGTQKLAGQDDPSTVSSDRAEMDAWLVLVDDVMAGAAAVRKAGVRYLPMYTAEGTTDYTRRLQSAPWRPEFADAVRNVSAKPFEEDVAFVSDDVHEGVKELCEDVDGQGNNMTQFASKLFQSAVAKGVSFLVVDFPNVDPESTLEENVAQGARPFWIRVDVTDVLALYSDWRDGREVFTHFRYRETAKRRVGFAEVVVHRIRVYDEGTWQVWEKLPEDKEWRLAKDDRGQDMQGNYVRGGNPDDTSVPVVPLFLGERLSVLKTKPPLLDLADMQIELYRCGSRKDEVLEFAGSPVLTANGMTKPRDGSSPLVGPKAVLYAGTKDASWEYISPESSNIEQIRQDMNQLVDDMRRLGMQPLTPNSGTQSATGEAIDAATTNSTCKAWAGATKDVLEQALKLTCEWLKLPDTVEVSVFTDWSVTPFAQAPLTALSSARSAGDLSQRTLWNGLRRFGVLPQDFDPEAEEDRLREEDLKLQDGGGADGEVDPETGEAADPETPANDDDAEPVDVANMDSYDDLSEDDLRRLVGDEVVDAAVNGG